MMDAKSQTLRKWQGFTLRWLITVAVLSAIVWIGSRVMLQRQNAADRAYYESHVQATLEHDNLQLKLFDQATELRKQGIMVPLPELNLTGDKTFSEWLARRNNQTVDYLAFGFYGQMGFLGACMATVFASIFFRVQANRLKADPDRSADPEAGQWVAGYKASGDVLVSKPKIKKGELLRFAPILIGVLIGIFFGYHKAGHGPASPGNHSLVIPLLAALVPIGILLVFLIHAYRRGRNLELQVDSAKGIIRFFNFTFTAKFTDNKAEPLVELPFSEILVVTTETVKGRTTMGLRTTHGRVFIGEQFEHFDELVPLFTDIAETNRRDLAAYGEALKREPVIRTPWYGWLPIVVVIVVVYLIFRHVTQS
ncbi:MAG TPA: hypothetical protein VL357_12065 [Rariglobus sp.]|jgi:hypothetical protein|nr:hypothetical protein [Rariglobus sp.]